MGFFPTFLGYERWLNNPPYVHSVLAFLFLSSLPFSPRIHISHTPSLPLSRSPPPFCCTPDPHPVLLPLSHFLKRPSLLPTAQPPTCDPSHASLPRVFLMSLFRGLDYLRLPLSTTPPSPVAFLSHPTSLHPPSELLFLFRIPFTLRSFIPPPPLLSFPFRLSCSCNRASLPSSVSLLY